MGAGKVAPAALIDCADANAADIAARTTTLLISLVFIVVILFMGRDKRGDTSSVSPQCFSRVTNSLEVRHRSGKRVPDVHVYGVVVGVLRSAGRYGPRI